MLRQELPHDGVAALAPPAVNVPMAPTPPIKVSVAAAASTLVLMDINGSSLGTRSCTLRTAARSWPRGTRGTRSGPEPSGLTGPTPVADLAGTKNSDTGPRRGGPVSLSLRHSFSEPLMTYFRIPKSAPQSWSSFTVARIGPGMNSGGLALDSPVMLVTTICGRGLSGGTDRFG